MSEIKFGTDGWRAVIAEDFTIDNLKRVAYATAKWIKKNYPDNLNVVIGHDCRFGGDLFSKTTARVMANEGIHVFLGEGFSSTPMISLGVKEYGASAGIVITASHNPPSYNGFKIKAEYGGPAIPSMIAEVESFIPETYEGNLASINKYVEDGLISFSDLEILYINHAENSFDLDAIRNSGLKLAYDAMYGAGQNVIRRILPETTLLHAEFNPSFKGTAPEPIMKNLQEFSRLVKEGNFDAGLATDGDADRIGLLNSRGEFVDSHHIILMLINYLHKHKGMNGQVINSFSCTQKIDILCKKYGLEHEVTKIGFKYICDLMLNDEEGTLVGGEESGGIAVAGHIPERDGIWIGLTIWEYMAKTGKTLDDLIREVYDIVGKFWVDRYDLHIEESRKVSVMKKCENNEYSSFGPFKVENIENLDGFKFHFNNGNWMMIRPSGTEPVLRIYAEAGSREEAVEILEATKKEILK